MAFVETKLTLTELPDAMGRDNFHAVHFYRDDRAMLDELRGFVGLALKNGGAAVVIATHTHAERLSQKLKDMGIDLPKAGSSGRYTTLNASDTLLRFMVNERPDRKRFLDIVEPIIEEARKAARNHGGRVVAFGEMVAMLWSDGNANAALDLEQLWNELIAKHAFSLLCAYPTQGFSRSDTADSIAQICAKHTALLHEGEQRKFVLDGEGQIFRMEDIALPKVEWQQREEPFRLFIENVEDYAIFMLDAEGKIATWNAGAERAKGYSASEIIGRHFSVFYCEEDVRKGKPQRLLDLAAKQGHISDEGWRVRRDGTRFWANVTITAVKDQTGKLIGFGKVTRDLTELMLAQEAVEESKRKLLESEASLRELSLHLLRTQDEERRVIGRDIHDSLGQYLAVLKMKLDGMISSPASEEISECADLVEECVKQVRTVSYLLYPPMLEELGLASAVPWYLDGFSKRSGIKTSLRVAKDLGRLSRDAELVLFRVLQEGLTNVQRHSGSKVAEIRIARRNDEVKLEIIDEGSGLPHAVLEQGSRDWMGALGVGLRGMSERLRQLGGSLKVTSDKNGTHLCAAIPLRAEQDKSTRASA